MRRHRGIFPFVGLAILLAVTLPSGAVAEESDRSDQLRERLATSSSTNGEAPRLADGSPKIPLDGHGAALLPDHVEGGSANSPRDGVDVEAARAAGATRPQASPSSSSDAPADRGASRRVQLPSSATASGSAEAQRAKGGQAQSASQREAALDELAATAASEGSARAIIGLSVDWHPGRDGAAQRADIAAERSALAREVEPHGARVTHTYDALPLVAFELPSRAVDALRRSSRVASVTPDLPHYPQLRETIPQVEAGSSFGLATCPASGGSLCGGSGTTVAIIDSGVDRVHPFFGGSSASRVVEEACFSANGSCPNGGTSQTGTGAGVPCQGASACFHGTHVAGIAAGRSSSLTGVAPGADVMSVNVFSVFTGSDCAGAGSDPCISAFTSDILAGLNRVANRAEALATAGRPIASVNMSLGTGATFPSSCDSQFPAYVTAVNNLRSAGVEVVVASGNSGAKSGISAPACISATVSVGAVSKSDGVASFSNSSPELDMLAPGVDVFSAAPGTCGSASGCFVTSSGTSMAAPHVAGAYAVLRSEAPDATPSSMTSVIASTGKSVTDSANGRTSPRLLVRSALQALLGGSTDPGTGEVCPPDDPFEPNEVDAPILSSGASLAGIACNDDFFAVWVEAGETVTASLTFVHAEGDLDLKLYGPSGTSDELDTSESDTDNEAVSAVASESGYHFAYVYPFIDPDDENSYTLTMTATGCGDAFSPNDGFGSAPTLTLPTGGYAQICPDEEFTVAEDGSVSGGDWFRFSANQDDFIAVDLFFEHAAGDIDVYLLEDAIYDAARGAGFSQIEAINAAILGYGQSVDNDETLTVRAPATGEFTVLVLGFDGALNDYFFSIFTDTTCINDAGDSGVLEEEQIKQVDPVFGEVFTGMICADDVDLYGLQVPNGYLIYAQLAFLRETGGGVGIALFAPNGDIIIGQDDPETEFVEDPFVLHQTPVSWPEGTVFEWDPNTWYVAVLGETEFVENFYNLFIFGIEGQGGEGGTGGPVYDEFASAHPLSGLPNDAVSEMSNLGAGAETNEPPHANRSAKHSVWFDWTAQQTGPVTFTTRSSGPGDIAVGTTDFNTVMAAYSGGSALTALTELDANDDAPDAQDQGANWSEVTFDAVKGETYMIAVDSFAQDDTGNLRLEWSQQQALPAAPSGLTAAAGNKQVVLAWDVVEDDGRKPIEGYQIDVSPSGGPSSAVPLGQLTRVGDRWQYVVDGLSNGTAYSVDVTALAAGGEAGGTASAGPVTPSAPAVTRHAGQDRFETAALASQAAYAPGVPVAYVATGRNFPDALAGAPLAARDGGPILLVDTDAVPTATSAELTRLQPGRIVVLGGTAAVSSAVETQLGSFTSGGVTRISGSSRYETAAKITGQFAQAEVVYVATGGNFPDALAGGAAAAAEGGPVLLVDTNQVPAATSAELARLNPTRIVVLGGTGAVSQAVFDELSSSTSAAVVRLAGADRYETGSLIVQGGAFTTPVPTAYVATGKNFPDALAGGAIAGLDGSPVILVPPTGPVPSSVLGAVAAMVPQNVVVLGGSGAVADEVANQIRTAAG